MQSLTHKPQHGAFQGSSLRTSSSPQEGGCRVLTAQPLARGTAASNAPGNQSSPPPTPSPALLRDSAAHPVRPAGATSGCQLPAALSPSPRSLRDHICSSREGRAGLLPAARGRSRGPSGRGELRVPPQGGGTGSLLSPAQRRQQVGVLGPCKSTTRAPQSPTGWANLARAEGELPLPEHRPLRAFSPSTGARHTPSPQPSAAGQQNQAPLPRHEQHEGTQRAQGHPSTESCPHEKLRLCVTGAVPETQAGSDHTCLKPTALRRDGSPARLCRRCLLRGVSAGCWPRRGDQPGARCPSCSSSGSTSSRCSGAGPLACSSWLGSATCSCPSAQRQREGEQSEGAAHIPGGAAHAAQLCAGLLTAVSLLGRVGDMWIWEPGAARMCAAASSMANRSGGEVSPGGRQQPERVCVYKPAPAVSSGARLGPRG